MLATPVASVLPRGDLEAEAAERRYAESVFQRLPEGFNRRVKAFDDEMITFRRDVHAHPELSRAEVRTTRLVRERLEAAGLRPRVLPAGTGLICEVNPGPAEVDLPGPARSAAERDRPIVALRADLDALPLHDVKDVPYRSTVTGSCHACGHDAHTAILLGAGLALADLAAAGRLPGSVRLIFQHAEEVMPGGALDAIDAGALDGVTRIFALHCDPRLDVGHLGLRVGAVTGATDHVAVRLTGPGGHTARPHRSADLAYALGKVLTDTAAALSRRVDPRSGLNLVWGRVAAGTVANAIPSSGEAEGTLRCLDLHAWEQAPGIVTELVRSLANQYGVEAEVEVTRGVPPCVNEKVSVAMLGEAAAEALGRGRVADTEQSLGGEDFAWYLGQVPGALARLGVRTPGSGEGHDLHQACFDIDERAIAVGIRVSVATALRALADPAPGSAPAPADSRTSRPANQPTREPADPRTS